MLKQKYLLLLILVGIIYWRVYDYTFLLWDDNSHVYAHPFLNPLTFSHLIQIWSESYRGFYIPVTYTFWAIIGFFFGFKPAVFHLVNVALHFGNVCLLFGLIKFLLNHKFRNIRSNEVIAFLCAALFAVHPIQVETVAWVTGGKDLLPAFLSLLTMKYYFAHKNKIISTIFFCLAVLAKPAVIGLPAVIFCLNYFFLNRALRVSLQGLMGWAVMSIGIGILTKTLQPNSMIEMVSPLWLRPIIVGDALSFYIYHFLFPIHLMPVYGRTPELLLQTAQYGHTLILPLCLFCVALAMRKVQPWFLGSFLIFCIAIGPVSGIIPFIFQNYSTVADHYFYFPMIGLILALAFAIGVLSERKISMNKIGYGLGLILFALMIKSSDQIKVWENEDTFFPYAEANAPKAAILEGNHGISLFNRQQYTEALKHFNRAVELKKDPVYYNDIGSAWIKLGNREKGRQAFLQGLAVDPNDATIKDNMSKLGL